MSGINPLTGQFEGYVMQDSPFGNSASPTGQSSSFDYGKRLSQFFKMKPQMNQGIGSFKTLLSPILQNIERQNKMEFVEKIDPYVQQVEQLTQQTFPNMDFSMSNGFGGSSNMSGENQFGVLMGNSLPNLNTTSSPEQSGSINTSPFGNSLRGGLGSIMSR